SKLPSYQNHFAGSSSSPSQARMWVATRSRNIRSWEMTTAQPGNSSSAFSSDDSVSTSRSLVGSSSSSRLPPIFRVSARLSRFRSPPDSTPVGFCWSGPLNPNAATYARDGISTLPTMRWSSPSETTSQTVLFGSSPERPWSTYDNFTVSPIFTVPLSGCSNPTIVLKSVVLPTPFGPMMPTIPLRGSENDRSLISTRSPKPLTRWSTSITVLPRRGPGGIWISSKSSLRVFSASLAISSYRSSRARDLVWRARAFDRTHSSSSARRFLSLASLRPSTAMPACFFSSYVDYLPSYGYACPRSTSSIH